MVYLSTRHPKEGWFDATKEVMDLSEIHDCEKSKGKIVSISIDKLGVERCGYCGEIVPYVKKKMLDLKIFQKGEN